MTDAVERPAPEPQKRKRGFLSSYTADEEIVGAKQTAVFVYEWPVRLWHWVNAFAILALMITGYLIASPFPSVGGEASDHFIMGTVRMIHFIAGQLMAVGFLARGLYAFIGNHHAKQLFAPPLLSKAWWDEVVYEARWYLFLEKEPKKYIGHNPLAQLAMFTLFVFPALLMIITGLALYGEGAGGLSHALFTSWVIPLFGNSFNVHTVHHWGMWVLVIFAIVHIYAAVREDIMSRQSLISTMVSGWRMFKDDKP